MKSPKKEDDDDDFLEDLVVDSNPEKAKETDNVFKPETGGFVTKAEDRKERLEKRQAKIETTKEQDNDNDDDDDDEETEKEQLERETRELQSELRKTERAAEKLEIKRNEKKRHGSAKGYRVEYS